MAVPAGITVALLTPLTDDGGVDHLALERLVRYAIAGGVTGVSPLGSTGEGFSLSLAQRLEVIGAATDAAGPGVPVIAGVFAHGPGQAAEEIAAYASQGAAGVLLAPPNYYPLNPAEQSAFFREVADASALPIVLYNIPVYTKVSLDPAVVADLAGHPRIVAIKDSGRDFGYFQSVLDAVRTAGVAAAEFAVLTGTDAMLLGCLLEGGSGSICASANVVPQLPAGILAAVRAGDFDRARDLERNLRLVLAACRPGGPPAGVKAAAAALGLCAPRMVPPRIGLTEDEVTALGQRLAEAGVVPAAASGVA